MGIPTDQNIAVKEFDKLSKYKELEIEIDRMWNMNAITVPVIVNAFGMIKRAAKSILTKSQDNHISRKSNK